MNQRPTEEEYAGDFGENIRLVPEGNIIDILLAQEKQMTELLASLTESHGAYRYAEGKWTLKEVVGHIADGERVMTYRLLRFAIDHDLSTQSLTSLCSQLDATRKVSMSAEGLNQRFHESGVDFLRTLLSILLREKLASSCPFLGISTLISSGRSYRS
ncbi:DinB family protein [Peribacillus frigoritolerans]|uniref:DinB family protein n=1 Tax=Peribacillus frigoritolerans TaxID=450367 RepID=UPI003F508278